MRGDDYFMLLVTVAGIIVLAWVIYATSNYRAQFMSECTADGRKPYECASMLHGSRP